MTLTHFGFRPEPPDPRHYEYETLLKPRLARFAQYTDRDLREFSPNSQRHNQLNTSSCVANAIVRGLELRRNIVAGTTNHESLSRLALYYLARELMVPPETKQDAGTFVSKGCDVLRRFGVCTEEAWPFDPKKVNVSPPWLVMRKAYLNKITAYYRIKSSGQERVAEVARCLQAGLPVVYGTLIGSEWDRYSGDIDKMAPLSLPQNPQGGHATVLIGTRNGLFIGENSWGPTWGGNGFYYLDPKVVASPYSSDFWVMENANDPWTQGK